MPDLFLATVNVPGYLPMSDDRHAFRDAASAWEYLLNERERDLGDPMNDEDEDGDGVIDEIFGYVETPAPGTVYGHTPGSDSPHDLGLAYSVTLWQHAAYPHEAGHLYDCPLCEYTCFCDPDLHGGTTLCVHCALIMGDESLCEDGDCDATDH